MSACSLFHDLYHCIAIQEQKKTKEYSTIYFFFGSGPLYTKTVCCAFLYSKKKKNVDALHPDGGQKGYRLVSVGSVEVWNIHRMYSLKHGMKTSLAGITDHGSRVS